MVLQLQNRDRDVSACILVRTEAPSISYSLALQRIHRPACNPTVKLFFDFQLPTGLLGSWSVGQEDSSFFAALPAVRWNLSRLHLPHHHCRPRHVEPWSWSKMSSGAAVNLARPNCCFEKNQVRQALPRPHVAELDPETHHHERYHKAGFIPSTNDFLGTPFFYISDLHTLIHRQKPRHHRTWMPQRRGQSKHHLNTEMDFRHNFIVEIKAKSKARECWVRCYHGTAVHMLLVPHW